MQKSFAMQIALHLILGFIFFLPIPAPPVNPNEFNPFAAAHGATLKPTPDPPAKKVVFDQIDKIAAENVKIPPSSLTHSAKLTKNFLSTLPPSYLSALLDQIPETATWVPGDFHQSGKVSHPDMYTVFYPSHVGIVLTEAGKLPIFGSFAIDEYEFQISRIYSDAQKNGYSTQMRMYAIYPNPNNDHLPSAITDRLGTEKFMQARNDEVQTSLRKRFKMGVKERNLRSTYYFNVNMFRVLVLKGDEVYCNGIKLELGKEITL